MFQRQVKVRNGLSLYALCAVYYEQCTFASGYTSAYFITKVYVARSIYKVEHKFLAIVFVQHLNGVGLYGDALFALQVHIIQSLGYQLAVVHCFSYLKQAVGQGAFTMVNVRYDAKIPYVFHARKNSLQPTKNGAAKVMLSLA
jgi:hypothetical protein